MAGTTINRLSDRRARTAGAGMHADGGGLYLRVTCATAAAKCLEAMTAKLDTELSRILARLREI